MNIGQKTKVALSYVLNVDGQVADKASVEQPLEFFFGLGMLLPDFEKNIEGKAAGDKFAFTLTPENGYGEINPEAVVELPQEIFMVDGKIVEEAITIGNVLPMGDNQGNKMMGTVKEVNENTITMDFNHPMAGKVLNFEGEIVSVAEATDEDIQAILGSGEGCGCGCGDDCDCDENKEGCGCGC